MKKTDAKRAAQTAFLTVDVAAQRALICCLIATGMLMGLVGRLAADSFEGPSRIRPSDAGVGRQVPDLAFQTVDGRRLLLGELFKEKGLLIAMHSTTCPVSKRYSGTLTRLQSDLAAKGIGLLLVNPFSSENASEIASFIKEHSITAPYVCDGDQKVAFALRASSTTEVLLLDASRTLVYRGAIDDQFGLGYHLSKPRNQFLMDAVDALLAGHQPRVAATEAPGCELDLPTEGRKAAGNVTYHRDVARILQQNCLACHREGGIAPFALDSPDAVLDRARTIGRVVEQGHMPPWFAAPAPLGGQNPWANDRSLSERDKSDLLDWLRSSDRPLGSVADAPAPVTFASDWTISAPDLVLQLPKPISIKANGVMPYQFVTVDTGLAEEKWVEAVEILPSARDVVHHVLVQELENGASEKKIADGTGGFWAAYVPGNGARIFPQGFARRLRAGTKLVFQIHYTPNGREVHEQMRLGLVFAKQPPDYEMSAVGVSKKDLSIPPGAPNHVEVKERKVPFDMYVSSFMPHMHVRGKAFKYELLHEDGKQETLLDIPHYDFNWQLSYDLKQPRFLPKGSRVRITAVFDNSVENKANPDPTKLVKWGSQTSEEMMIGYMEIFRPAKGSN